MAVSGWASNLRKRQKWALADRKPALEFSSSSEQRGKTGAAGDVRIRRVIRVVLVPASQSTVRSGLESLRQGQQSICVIQERLRELN